MKDEEIAEQFADKECCETCHDIFRTCKERCECWEFAKKGFLAGLKEGRPQWHDLRKNPNGLPNDDRIVSDQEGDNVRYVKHLNKWFYRHRTCEADVIAWCEIPQFKE